MRVSMMIDTMRAKIKADTNAEAGYNAGVGGVYAARHILFGYPEANGIPGQSTPAQKDSVRKLAMSVLPQVTTANFAAMAKKYSTDKGTAVQGGNLGVFDPTSGFVPEFVNGTAALKPGQISKLVESQFGLHIIQRLPYAEVKAQYGPRYPEIAQRSVDSTLTTDLMAKAAMTVKDNAGPPVKEAIKNPAAHHTDKMVIATFKGGEMNVGEFLGWVDVMPGQYRQQVMQIVPTWPDSQVKAFVKTMAMRQLLLHQADSAKLDVPAAEKMSLTVQFAQLVQDTWDHLGLTPKSLADSAKSEGAREKLAARRVDTLMAKIMNGEASPVGIPIPLKSALNSKWEATINATAIDHAVDLARKARTSADSARAAAQPSQVPMPGMGDSRAGAPPTSGPPPAAAPPPATKPPATKKKP
jgi:hypothetical protein